MQRFPMPAQAATSRLTTPKVGPQISLYFTTAAARLSTRSHYLGLPLEPEQHHQTRSISLFMLYQDKETKEWGEGQT